MAELQKTPLEQLIDWISSWKVSFDQLRERIGWPLTVLIVLAAAGGFFWWKCDEIAKRPGVKWLIERLKRGKIKPRDVAAPNPPETISRKPRPLRCLQSSGTT